MAARMHRTQILLEPEQHQALGQIARKEGRSVSDVVREFVRQALCEREQREDAELQRDLEALERIRLHREEILAERGGKPLDFDVVEAINQARDEQDDRNFSLIFGNRD
jgi:predicted DNA-binding protein